MGKLGIERKEIIGIQIRGIGIKAQKQELNADSGLSQLVMGLGSKDTKVCEVQVLFLKSAQSLASDTNCQEIHDDINVKVLTMYC